MLCKQKMINSERVWLVRTTAAAAPQPRRMIAAVVAATLLRFVVVVVTVDDHAMLQHLLKHYSNFHVCLSFLT